MLILGILLITSFSSFASDSCRLRDLRGFHPSGAPYTRVQVNCSDALLQSEILNRYAEYQVGIMPIFLGESKNQIVHTIQIAGYEKIKNNFFIKE